MRLPSIQWNTEGRPFCVAETASGQRCKRLSKHWTGCCAQHHGLYDDTDLSVRIHPSAPSDPVEDWLIWDAELASVEELDA